MIWIKVTEALPNNGRLALLMVIDTEKKDHPYYLLGGRRNDQWENLPKNYEVMQWAYVHPPKTDVKEFEIWSEGFEVMEGRGLAMCHGKLTASSFKEACDKLAEIDKGFNLYYSPEKMTYWGCRLFDNEMQARESFG